MKISEMIKLLEVELAKRGDVEVQLHGAYGAAETTFQVLKDQELSKKERTKLNIWTNINTG